MNLSIYLNFNGTTEEAFNYYKSVFKGEFTALIRFGEMQGSEEIPPQFHNKIMHISLPIANITLMATDAIPEMGQQLIDGNAYSIAITTDSREQTDALFMALSDGGTILIPLEESS